MNLFRKLWPVSGRKDSAMADTPLPQTAIPPASSGGLTEAQIAQIAASAVTAALSTALKPITDQLGALAQSQTALAAAQKNAVTADAIGKTVADAIDARSAVQAANQARTDFVVANLKGVPKIYADKLGADQSKWADEA
jgi:hypothetical protein